MNITHSDSEEARDWRVLSDDYKILWSIKGFILCHFMPFNDKHQLPTKRMFTLIQITTDHSMDMKSLQNNSKVYVSINNTDKQHSQRIAWPLKEHFEIKYFDIEIKMANENIPSKHNFLTIHAIAYFYSVCLCLYSNCIDIYILSTH